MTRWETAANVLGCFALFATFCVALLIGAVAWWTYNQMHPYIDQDAALRLGLEHAQARCRNEADSRLADCARLRQSWVQEDLAGWFLIFASVDGRRRYSMYVGRKGEYETIGGSDMDAI